MDTVTDETDAGNNCSVGVEIGVEKPLFPDLVVGAPAASENTLQVAAAFTLSATVTNLGDGDAETTTLRFLDTENQLGQADVQALTAGGTDAGSLDLTAPSAAGTYRYGACVDEVEDESDTTNNCSWVSLPVGRANLVTTIPRIFQRDLGGGTGHLDHVVHTVVRNVGTVMSPAPRVTLYGSWDATASPDDKLYRTFNLMPLAPGAVDCYSYGYVAPPQKRDYYYAVVDMVPNETSTEDNESDVTKAPLECNNCVRTDHPSGWCANRR